MSTHVAQSKDKRRRAVAIGKRVVFYRRKLLKTGYATPKAIWFKTCKSHAEAIKTAEAWVSMVMLRGAA